MTRALPAGLVAKLTARFGERFTTAQAVRDLDGILSSWRTEG